MNSFLGIFLVNALLGCACCLAIGAAVGLVALVHYYTGLVGAVLMGVIILVFVGSLLEWAKKRTRS